MDKPESIVPFDRIEKSIFLIRGQKVMFDSDLALLYGTTTKRLNEQVRRNNQRFPSDFMFQLSDQEVANLRSQFATSSLTHGGRRSNPLVFTEHGVVMLASVLDSDIAVRASIQIVKTFVRMREMISTHEELLSKLERLERRYDAQFKVVFNSIKELITAKPKEAKEVSKKTKLGFGRE